MSRYFIDFEFWAPGPGFPIYPLSIGLVPEEGDGEFYAEYAPVPPGMEDEWIAEHVLPYLTGPALTRREIAARLLDFIGTEAPELWGYFCGFDFVLLSQLFGGMDDYPNGWPMYFYDIAWLMQQSQVEIVPQKGSEHHALMDAKWIRDAHRELRTLIPVDKRMNVKRVGP